MNVLVVNSNFKKIEEIIQNETKTSKDSPDTIIWALNSKEVVDQLQCMDFDLIVKGGEILSPRDLVKSWE